MFKHLEEKIYLLNKSKALIPFLIALLFALFLAYFNFLEYSSYQYTQFDLGVGYRTLYNFHASYHLYNWPFPPIETPHTFSKLIYVPLSFTLYIYNSPLTFLFDQIIMISLGGVALFYISRLITNDYKLSVVIETIYFLYPATYGFMTQGGNFMVFFEPLLLIGYFFYLRENKLLTFILFVLISITNAFAPLILIVLLSIPYLSKLLLFLKKEWKSRFALKVSLDISEINAQKWKFVLLLIPASIFTIILSLYGVNVLIGAARLDTAQAVSSSGWSNIFGLIFTNFSEKFNFFNEVFQPLLYLPLLTLYAFPILIYILLAWYSNQSIYYDMLPRQYTFLFAGLLFISLVYSIKKLTPNKKIKRIIGLLIIITTIISFALYSPFCVSNIQNGSFADKSTITPLEKNLTESLALIPLNSSVLTQNDIVQVMNRREVYFPGYYSGQPVNYAIFAPPGQYGIENPASGFSENLANQFAINESYGLYVRLGNIEIYKLSYNGPPVMFSKEIISGKSAFASETGISNNIITFSTPFTQLSPGYYNISFYGTTTSSASLISGNIIGNLTMLGSDGYYAHYSHIQVILLENNSQLSFSITVYMKVFDYYALNLNFNLAAGTYIAYNGTTSYSVTSVVTM
ncbi:MAG: DUF2079 domain-containing protein [Thermoplasmatales archaeon]